MNSGLARLAALPWRRSFFDWLRADGPTWVFILKMLLAAWITLWLAMRLELPQPRIAMISVVIVMQAQSGQVFAKSFYRLLGTLAGSSMTVLLMALFPQNSELFLPSLALWVGLCSAGAQRHRNFRGYAFVLAGYTAALVGLPVLQHPDEAFMAAIWRVLEIFLGLLVATFVSALVLPQSTSAALRNALYLRFGTFTHFMLQHLEGQGAREDFEDAQMRFVGETVGLEAQRGVTAFEDPHMRRRSGRISRLNSEFMGLCTRFNALHQLLARLPAQSAVRAAAEPALQALAQRLRPYAGRPLTDADAVLLAASLAYYQAGFAEEIRQLRARFLEQQPDEAALLELHTTFELLYRLVLELHDYAQTHASLAAHSHAREQWHTPYQAQTSWLACVASGLRGAAVLLGLGSYWLATDWPSGDSLVLVAAITVGLSAATPNPRRHAFQMACGTAIGALAGFVEYFYIYPRIDGFVLLCLALAPVLALGALLLSRPRGGGYGAGLLIFFCMVSVPGNPTHFAPHPFFNEYFALLLGTLVAAVAGAVILPPNSRLFWNRLQRDLRGLMVPAIRGELNGPALESRTRDLVHQAYGLASGRPDVQRQLLRWMFAVLEIGHAIIELGREQSELPVHPAYHERQAWRQSIRALGRSLIRLFAHPTPAHLARSLRAVNLAIDEARNAYEPLGPHFDTSVLRRVQSYLHFIRSSLLDPRSPFTEYGAAHAA